MARGRKFRSTRRIPDTERSLFEQKLTGRYTRTLDRTDLLGLIRGTKHADRYLVVSAHYDHLGVRNGVICRNSRKVANDLPSWHSAKAVSRQDCSGVSGTHRRRT